MIERPPLPSVGNSFDATVEYQMSAGFAGGSFLIPVLRGERFSGDCGSRRLISFFASKSKSGSASFGPMKSGQPKFPAVVVALISS